MKTVDRIGKGKKVLEIQEAAFVMVASLWMVVVVASRSRSMYWFIVELVAT